ncbi:sperm-associated microtubule inner protein 4-like [Montipora capricornis]|uniref:sperm-associated microtubule inner protein 4-like n=1 Tax=Montipora capricornis TaxID=246305 RepID=UPI0035F1257E
MALDVNYLSKLQYDLYREKHGYDKLSRNFQSAPVHDPSRFSRITTYPDRYSRHLEQADIHVKCPWGRARSYAGEAPVCLPSDHRPKWEPPPLLQKGHRHYGSGASPHPRGVPLQQFYNLTQLKKSKVRWNDELMPRPTTANVQGGQIVLPFPKESPMSSHMSRQAMFPKPEQSLSPAPPPVILNKAMGSFGRREIITPVINSRTAAPPKHQAQPVQLQDNWFSKHEVTSQFNRLHPSTTPTIRLNIQRRRRADWQLVQ